MIIGLSSKKELLIFAFEELTFWGQAMTDVINLEPSKGCDVGLLRRFGDVLRDELMKKFGGSFFIVTSETFFFLLIK